MKQKSSLNVGSDSVTAFNVISPRPNFEMYQNPLIKRPTKSEIEEIKDQIRKNYFRTVSSANSDRSERSKQLRYRRIQSKHTHGDSNYTKNEFD